MATGLKALHDIDSAIGAARTQVSKAAKLPSRASEALADINRRQVSAYADIAKVRLEVIDDGESDGSLGYVDRQAAKLLAAHAKEETRLFKKADASLARITKLEIARRAQERTVDLAVKAFEKSAEACQRKLAKDPEYQALEAAEEATEATIYRAQAKQEVAEADVEEKGAPYRNDPYFTYLQKRQYGTKEAKGWFLTKWFDSILARKGNYREAALNYKKLTDIPGRLAGHVEALVEKHQAAEQALEKAEKAALVREGVTKLKQTSLSAQKKLDKIDADIEVREEEHQALRTEQAKVSGGDSAPYREAIDLLVNTLQRKNLPSLKRLASQTRSRDDDQAIARIAEYARRAEDLQDDQAEAQVLLAKYQDSLRGLEQLRRKFKNRRYDAPTSQFPRGNLMGTLLMQLVGGMLSSGDVWRQIERAQRTVQRSSRGRTRGGFGGGDWGEAMRLPRSSGGFGGGSSGGFGGWGGGRSTRRGSSRRGSSFPRPIRAPRRAPMPRTPRTSRSGGGFRTGGGF
ncbi:MAG: hypothetical protein L3J05_09475 [Robiginitomaculum sp.]|nr:hypothetical protein [Robiginitomaculum sp.]